MTHYDERMQEDLDEIRTQVRKISERVEDQVRDAVHSLLEEGTDLANQVILGDRRVNRQIREIDRLCHAFIVRHAPSAGHLRYVSAVLRFDVALERVGDYAGTICREVVQLEGRPPGRVARDIELISQQSRRALGQALTAFQDGDLELAQRAHGLADQTDVTLEKVFEDLLSVGKRKKIALRDIFSLLRIINLLKRVAEQADNIFEQTMFALTGETEDPKIFRILFIDERNDGASQIAEAYAQKAFPKSGVYSSAGWDPASELDPGFTAFMDQNGIDMRGRAPSGLRPIHREPRHFHVVVALAPNARDHLPQIPFRTVYLQWDLDAENATPPKDLTEDQFETLFKTIAANVRDLMHTLRGPDAR